MSTSNYAGFWLRFVAYLLDYIVIYIIQVFVFVPILGLLGFTMFATGGFDFSNISEEEAFGMVLAVMSAILAASALVFVIQTLYFSLMESSKYQATLGKMALGLKVTNLNGGRLDLGKSILRNIGKVISGMILLIGYIMAGFTDKKQALHDMIAGALVVKS